MYKLAASFSVLFFIFILWVISMANTGENSVFFKFVASIPYGDKLGHFCLFGLLTLGSNIAFKFNTVSLGRFNIYRGTFLVIIFVVLEELSQGFIPSRSMDIVDLLADSVGILVFTTISFYVSKICLTQQS